jgi:hypothetical protein
MTLLFVVLFPLAFMAIWSEYWEVYLRIFLTDVLLVALVAQLMSYFQLTPVKQPIKKQNRPMTEEEISRRAQQLQAGKEALEKLRNESPLNPEMKVNEKVD